MLRTGRSSLLSAAAASYSSAVLLGTFCIAQLLCPLHTRLLLLLLSCLQAKGSDGSGYDGEDTGDGDTEDGTDNGGSSRRREKPLPKRARLGGATSSHDGGGSAGGAANSQGGGKAAGVADTSDTAAAATSGAVAGTAAGYGGLDMMQLQGYQAQYWDPTQANEVSPHEGFALCGSRTWAVLRQTYMLCEALDEHHMQSPDLG